MASIYLGRLFVLILKFVFIRVIRGRSIASLRLSRIVDQRSVAGIRSGVRGVAGLTALSGRVFLRPMRWFFALNENSPAFWDYVNLVQVAVCSAREHTSLEPVCIYDGEESAFTAWLRAAKVTVIRRSTFLGGITIQMTPIARGAYLRLEVPGICREQGWEDEFVLYTDCDVMFQRDPEGLLQGMRPRFLAVAPEGDRDDLVRFNSGVMLINVPAWEAELPALTDTFRRHLDESLTPPYDQALLQRHFAGRIDSLPLELNWKSYWNRNDEAVILHFHGPKPAQKYILLNRRGPMELQGLANEHYFDACHRWDGRLLAAVRAVPLPREPNLRRVEPGFENYDEISGIGVPEGPFPAIMLPVVRWGIAPATEVVFTVPPGKHAEFEALFQCPHTDQIVTVTLNETELARIPIRRVSDPYAVRLDLPVGAGQHRLKMSYAHGYQQSNGDPRALAILFRALRIRII